MQISSRTPTYSLATPGGGRTRISQPEQGAHLALRHSNGHIQLPRVIIGFARIEGELVLYTAGTMASGFRSALEEEAACEEEHFFPRTVPAQLAEYRLDEYALGDLLYYPAHAEAPALMIAHVNAA